MPTAGRHAASAPPAFGARTSRTPGWRRRIAQAFGALVGLGATFGIGIAVLLYLCINHITPLRPL